MKVVGPILIDRSTSHITARLDPSNAFTIKVLGFISTPYKGNFTNIVLEMTFKEEPVPRITLDNMVSTHLGEI